VVFFIHNYPFLRPYKFDDDQQLIFGQFFV
jgi:hypothetical protein